MQERIAIVGIGCQFAESASPEDLWRNVLATRRSFREMPSNRMSMHDYYSADRSATDKTYVRMAAVLEDYAFDRLRFNVPSLVFRTFDTAHWLALDVASRVLADAGFESLPIDRRRVSVLVGNTLTGDQTRSKVLRLRWPYVSKIARSVLYRHGLSDEADLLLAEIEQGYKSAFDDVNEETLAGGLSNTIAGRICNYYDFGGGGYSIDGACSSSLIAVIQASIALQRNDIDFALAGGVDVSLDPFELVGFAKTSALAEGLMRVYDRRSEGFWPGEGCGMVALVREEDAVRWGLPVQAVIAGFGISSDGHGGITRPESDGHALAMERAYEAAGYGPDSVDMFEGHGTGTAVGDAAEVAAISGVRAAAGGKAPAALGSVKANIGHTKAAAGSAGLIKAVMSLRTGIVPPTTGCEVAMPALTSPDRQLEVRREAREWGRNRPVRASVSAVGFGGINSHLALEAGDGPRLRLWAPNSPVSRTGQDCELVPLTGRDLPALALAARELGEAASNLTMGRLSDLAISRCRSGMPTDGARAALIVRTPLELADHCRMLASRIERGDTTFCSSDYSFSDRIDGPRIGLLFSGQGAPVRRHAGAVGRRFPHAQRVLESAHLELISGTDTALAQPAIAVQSAVCAESLETVGITAMAAVGHSLGELAALQWAGYFQMGELIDLATVRGDAMSRCVAEEGGMVELGCSQEEARRLAADLRLSVAAFNGPDRTVVSGPLNDIRAVTKRAESRQIGATPLRVSHAFHSPLVAQAAEAVSAWFKERPGMSEREVGRLVISTVTGSAIDDPGGVADLLARQITEPVLFTQALAELEAQSDVLIEVGPGRILTDLASNAERPVFALDAGCDSLGPFLAAVGACFALGAPVDLETLAHGRVAFDTEPTKIRSTLSNPCESPADAPAPSPSPTLEVLPRVDGRTPPPPVPELIGEAMGGDVIEPGAAQDVFEVVRKLIVDKTEFPTDSVTRSSRFLVDLNLNSIAVAQVAADAARACGRVALVSPHEQASGTVGDLVASLEGSPQSASEGTPTIPQGVEDWIRPFDVVWVPARVSGARRPVSWSLHGCGEALCQVFGGGGNSVTGSTGVAVELPPIRSAEDAVAAIRILSSIADTPELTHVVVGAHSSGPALARTLQLERPELTIRVLDLDGLEGLVDSKMSSLIRRATESGTGFEHYRVSAAGELETPRMREASRTTSPINVSPEGVIVVTGGGKGIGAEAALALATTHRTTLGIIGRTQPTDDPEVSENLAKFEAAGLKVCYVSADVTDRASLAEAIGEIVSRCGPIVGIVHAAGINNPGLLRYLSPGEITRTWQTKVDGFDNLLTCADSDHLSLVVSFGSIIGRTGMRGEGHYAAANEQLRLRLESLAKGRPNLRVLHLEWSVWSGVGMGAKLGLLDSLEHVGVTPISPDRGVGVLRDLVASEGATSLVVSGRYGLANSIFPYAPCELPFLRFLERCLLHYPGIELVMEADLGPDVDRYLDDHALNGTLLFPSVAVLEAMAQAATALLPGRSLSCVRNLELHRAITIPRGGGTTMRVAALADGAGGVSVEVRSSETDFEHVHARAEFRATTETCASAEGRPEAPAGQQIAEAESSRMIEQLYSSLLFHGPRFRRVRSYEHVTSSRCIATVESDRDQRWFVDYMPQELVLGDLGARDAFLHAAQVCIPQRRVLPLRARQVRLNCSNSGNAIYRVDSRERDRMPAGMTFDVDAVDASGGREEWRGLELKSLEAIEPLETWTRDILSAYLQRRMVEVFRIHDAKGLDLRLVNTKGVSRDDRSRTALALLAPGEQAEFCHTVEGKPQIGCGHVSFSHHSPLTFAALSRYVPAGIDVESIEHRSDQTWRGMLGEDLFQQAMGATAETIRKADASAAECTPDVAGTDVLCTCLWSASECLTKLGVPKPHDLIFRDSDVKHEYLVVHRDITVLVYVARVSDCPEVLVFAGAAGTTEDVQS